MSNSKWWVGALFSALSLASSVSAQDAAKGEKQEDGAAEEEASRHPMGWFGIGVSVGAAGVGSGHLEVDNPTYDASGTLDDLGFEGVEYCPVTSPKCRVTTAKRSGFQLTLKMTMGGDGFGWELDPYANFASGANAYGLYTGPKFDIHATDDFYVGFGFGLKAAYVMADQFDYAADLYGRVPIRATYYLMNDLGIVAEVGFGYGASGGVAMPKKNPTTGEESDVKVNFGTAMTWDFAVGTRWP